MTKNIVQYQRRTGLWIAGLLLLFLFALMGEATQPPTASVFANNASAYGLVIPRAFLPIIMNCSDAMKSWSGVHLGNRTVSDWNKAFFRRIDPTQCGVWPTAIVVFSYQIYDVQRWPSTDPSNPCRVKSATKLMSNPVGFDYVKRAAQAGVKVIVRIYPSPGNFYDWNDLANQPNHHLSVEGPVGPNGYCDKEHYRSKGDIADEMNAIHAFNLSEGFSEFGFQPANEPNIEWYRDFPDSTVQRVNVDAWQEMDAYFSAIYDYAHANFPGVRVLTPPMAQSARADGINIYDCTPMGLADGIGTGYDYMPSTYGTKNDGVTWNNYWNYTKEIYNSCENGGMHVSYYFPQWMKNAIRNGNKPAFITEADLGYPANTGNALPNKDGSNANLAADSIRHFFDSEQESGVSHYGVQAVILSWLLTNTTSDSEITWHKAYWETGYSVRPWFQVWYTGQESWP